MLRTRRSTRTCPSRDLLHLTRNLNRRFDQRYAEGRLDALTIPLERKAGGLSGGRPAQLALTLALARRPRLLVLDEPVAMLDPIARHDFMATVLGAAADDGVSVLLSSHVLAELERVADYLILLSRGRVQVAGEVNELLAGHRLLTGPAAEVDLYAERPVVHVRRGEAQAHLLVRASADDPVRPGWEAHPVGLEELVLGYLREPRLSSVARAGTGPGPSRRTVGRGAMTALAIPARPPEDTNLRPVPWRRMVWITWRQHRFALIGLAILLGALAVYLWSVGRRMHHAYAAAAACHPASSIACSELIRRFNDMDLHLANGYVLQPLPVLIGAFVGAPLLARELETGTFRYAWTQGFGRWRWILAKLVLLAVGLVVAAGAMSALFSWYYKPYFTSGNETVFFSHASPLAAGLFDLRGVALPAWTLAAFAIGGLAGVLIRRVVPAIVATMVAYSALALAAALFLRRHYLAALFTSKPNVPATALVIRQWWTKGGREVFAGLPPINLVQQFCPPASIGAGKPSLGTLAACLSRHGYTRWTSYQPASRFWAFQSIEAGWLLVLSAVLIATTVWIVHRRAT